MSALDSSRLTGRLNDLRAHIREPLYRNAYALMANTAITAGLGMIATVAMFRTYPANEVGKGAALVSTMQLISAITQLNFASVLMRFLPRAGAKTTKLLLTAYGISISFAVLATTTVLGIAFFVAPENHVLHMSLGLGVAFVLGVAAYSIFNLQDAAITGLRRTIWVPIENGVFGIAKIVLIVVFASVFGALGIFAAWVIPLAILLIPVNIVIFTKFAKRNKTEETGGEDLISGPKIRKFIAGDYAGSLFNQAMTTLLPLLVISALGENETAFFIAAQTVSLVVDLIVLNLSYSFTVEASHDTTKIAQYTRQTLTHMARIVLPLVVVLYIAAPYLMELLGGKEYRENSTEVLQLMLLATPPRIFSSIYGSLARLELKTYKVTIVTAIQATVLIGASLLLMPHYGVNGVGFAALIAQLSTAVVIVPSVLRYIHASPKTAEIAR